MDKRRRLCHHSPHPVSDERGRDGLGEKPVTIEMFIAENLKCFLQGLLEINELPVDVQKAFYEEFIAEYKKLSKDDRKMVRSGLDILVKELFPEQIC